MRQMMERWEHKHGLDTLTHKSRRLVLISYGILVAALASWALTLYQQNGNLRSALVFLLPLLLFLPSLIARRPRGHAWLCFVSLLYFMIGVNVAILPGVGWLGLLIAMAALVLFVASMGYARFRSRQLRR
ncbi:DUF2069 domain-containing protein [Halomonas sp. YLGW01]|uniref:DUF2069 domain-containing protein n=1 Tax=Halomonas sp. YLGW01 TaxID=2773308 RepID=UPI001782F592|nr:DUF2069 domain-containing protein [Halomonas sp. YLGW01]